MYRPSAKPILHVDFSDPSKLTDWTINGTPTFTPDGIRLNGSTDYLLRPLTNFSKVVDIGGPQVFTVKCVFTPEFTYDEDVSRVLYWIDGAGSDDQYVRKQNNAGGNELRTRFFNGFKDTVPGDYSSYWKQGEKNTIVLSLQSTNIGIYLNSVQIDTSASNYSGAITNPPLYVGASNIGAEFLRVPSTSFPSSTAYGHPKKSPTTTPTEPSPSLTAPACGSIRSRPRRTLKKTVRMLSLTGTWKRRGRAGGGYGQRVVRQPGDRARRRGGLPENPASQRHLQQRRTNDRGGVCA